MYAAWFGLAEQPFAITPDPRYLYLGTRHAEAFAHLLYGLTESGGFIQLTGEVGTGKTTLTRRLLDELPEGVDAALVLNPRMSPLEFVRTICEELGVKRNRATTLKGLVDALNRHLLDAHARNRRSVLIVDEAQTAPVDLLEQLRLLTNLETPKTKLLQIILIGQPELRETLARRELRQLAQRITARYHLEPLSRAELDAYVKHRLEVAGASGPIFSEGALDAVFEASSGIPRLVNVICDRALLGAYAQERRDVDADTARRAAHEVLGEVGAPLKARARLVWPWFAFGAATPLVMLGAAWFAMGAPPPASLLAGEAAPITVEVPVPTPAAAAEAPPSPAFAERLAAGTLDTGTDTAFAALFKLWGRELAPGRPACDQAGDFGLRCFYQRGNWNTLRGTGRPAILTLETVDGAQHHAVVKRLGDTTALVALGALDVELPLAEIDPLWYGEYLLLWAVPPHGASTLRPGNNGEAVRWLRQQFATLRGLDPAAQGDVYDAELVRWVSEFQQQHRLKVDGYAGEQTLVQLDSALHRPETPTLSGS
jgi:general secretion pathway protein A